MYLFFDLDDTLLRSDKTVSDYTKEVLKNCQKRGDLIIINTARDYGNTRQIAEEIKADYVISCGGAEIYKNHELIYSEGMSAELITKLSGDLFYKPGVIGVTVQADVPYTRDMEYTSVRTDAVYFDFHEPFTKEAAKIVIGTEDEEGLVEVAKKYQLILTRYYKSNWYRLSKTTKGTGLNKLLELLEADKSKASISVAFGDDNGDVDMLKAADIGVALKNSTPEVLDEVEFVTDFSCDEDGCARYIVKHF